MQLAFGETKEKQLTKPELGHLKKAGAPPLRHLAEFRDEAGELKIGDHVTVDGLREGPARQGQGRLEGQGLSGHDPAPQLPPRPGQPRLAQRPRAGLDRRQRHARRA